MRTVVALNINISSSIYHTKHVAVHPSVSPKLICIIRPILSPHSKTVLSNVSSVSQPFLFLLA